MNWAPAALAPHVNQLVPTTIHIGIAIATDCEFGFPDHLLHLRRIVRIAVPAVEKNPPVVRRQQGGDVDSLARDEKIICEDIRQRAPYHSSRKIIIRRHIRIHPHPAKQTKGHADENALSRLRYCPDPINVGNDRFLEFGPLLVVANSPHLEAGKNEDQQRGGRETDKKTVAEQPAQARQPHREEDQRNADIKDALKIMGGDDGIVAHRQCPAEAGQHQGCQQHPLACKQQPNDGDAGRQRADNHAEVVPVLVDTFVVERTDIERQRRPGDAVELILQEVPPCESLGPVLIEPVIRSEAIRHGLHRGQLGERNLAVQRPVFVAQVEGQHRQAEKQGDDAEPQVAGWKATRAAPRLIRPAKLGGAESRRARLSSLAMPKTINVSRNA